MGFLTKLKDIFTGEKKDDYLQGFANTKASFGQKILALLKNSDYTSSEFLEDLMITLIEADLGYETALKICNAFKKQTKNKRLLQEELIDEIAKIMYDLYYQKEVKPINYNKEGITVFLLVGVNGSGKTTTCAKLAKKYKEQGKKVLLAAADTFRAGAVEQLSDWASRLDLPIIQGNHQEDPSSVLVKAARFAKENNYDILLCDTAGRLQNKKNLMLELSKMHKVLAKEIVGAVHNCWLVIDANTGQNGLAQANLFKEATNVDGIILTKIDGTSKGGIVLAIKDQCDIPVRYVGLGEREDDLKEFDAKLYLYSILKGLNNED